MGTKVAIFRHAASEPAGYFGTVFAGHAVPYEYVRAYETGKIMETGATRFLFMGRPVSVNNEKELPWLKEEKAPIRHAMHTGRPVPGICPRARRIVSAGQRPGLSVPAGDRLVGEDFLARG